MMRNNRRFLGGALVIGMIGIALIFWWRAASQQADQHQAAQQRWGQRSFRDYRMVLSQGRCTTDYEVRDERVAWGHETPCGRGQARSVTNLFSMIGDATEIRTCADATCACERITTTNVRYDSALGYPLRIAIRSFSQPNWGSGAFWQALGNQQAYPCSTQISERLIEVIEIVPRPAQP
jgi:hypothetical protein